MANKIIRMKNTQSAKRNANIAYTDNTYPTDTTSQSATEKKQIVYDTMLSPELRVLQEIRFLLLVIIIIELIVLFRR